MHYLTILITAVILLTAGGAPAQSGSADDFLPNKPPSPGDSKKGPVQFILIKPADKTSENVKADESNPFIKVAEQDQNPAEKGRNEEAKIHERLSKLRVCGVFPTSDEKSSLRVMLADMVLTEGQIMPPVLPDQTLALKVTKITRDTIQLQWLEQKFTGAPPRFITLPIDLRPSVRVVLNGEIPDAKTTAPKKESKAVSRVNGVRVPSARLEDKFKQAAAKTGPPPPRNLPPPPVTEKPAPPPESGATQPAAVVKSVSEPQADKKPEKVASSDEPKKDDSKAPEPKNTAQPEQNAPAKNSVVSSAAPETVPLPSKEEPTAPKRVKTGAVVITGVSPASADKKSGATGTPESAGNGPPQWQKALGLLENLAKVEEAEK